MRGTKGGQAMSKKPNPLLAAFEAKKEAEFSQRLAKNTEINMIAMLIAGNNLGFLGPARAGLLLEEQVEVKMDIAEALLADAKDDPTLAYTKADLARRLIQILGPSEWARCQALFPLLRDYWVKGDVVDGKI
jgi:hypothetical protein